MQLKKTMETNWEQIPSLDLEVDWNYEPENPQGKRSSVRLVKKDLSRMFVRDDIPVKIVSIKFDEQGSLVDISSTGLAVVLGVDMKVGMLVRVGFFLGKHKIISRGIVRNASLFADNYRIGIEFVQLDKAHVAFINSLNSAKVFTF
jgi:hypothetical protein